MKISLAAILMTAMLLFANRAWAGGEATADKESAKTSVASSSETDQADSKATAVRSRPIVYRPPKVGKPVHSVGGGSRGNVNTVPELFVIAPDHVGQTISAQPSLFWYINPVPDGLVGIEFAILDADSIEPHVETSLPVPASSGIQRIRLVDHGAALSTGVEYEWSVALIVDPDERSKDIVVMGWIDRVEAGESLQAKLAAVDRGDTAFVFAEEGIWYDALATLSEQIEQDPSNRALREERAELLRQVGLDSVASRSLR